MSGGSSFQGSSRALSQSHNTQLINDEFLRRLNETPEALTDAQLRRTPLRILAKGLTGISPDRVVDVYLRWLEVQRQSSRSNINFSWPNAITHWTQSLRARGFSLNDLTVKLNEWRKANGPFVDPHTSEEARYPPLWEDISFGWNQIAQGAAGAQLQAAAMSYDNRPASKPVAPAKSFDFRMENPLSALPSSYICNRCKGKGHLVTDCPTNGDPAYDLPPGIDYICKFCGEPGAHYYMFCPLHPGENSIHRQRLARQAQVEMMNYDRSLNRFASPVRESSRDMISMTQFPFTMSDTKNYPARGYATPNPQIETLKAPHSVRSLWSPKISSSDTVTIDRLHISSVDNVMIKVEEQKLSTRNSSPENLIKGSFEDEWSLDAFTTPGPRPLEIELEQSNIEYPETDPRSTNSKSATENRMAWERLYRDNQRINAKERRNLKRAYQLTAPTKISPSNPVITPSATKPPVYDEFLKKLFAIHTSQTYIRNRRSRPTALEMWDTADEQKRPDGAALYEDWMECISESGTALQEVDNEMRDEAIEELFEQIRMEPTIFEASMDVDKLPNATELRGTGNRRDTKELFEQVTSERMIADSISDTNGPLFSTRSNSKRKQEDYDETEDAFKRVRSAYNYSRAIMDNDELLNPGMSRASRDYTDIEEPFEQVNSERIITDSTLDMNELSFLTKLNNEKMHEEHEEFEEPYKKLWSAHNEFESTIDMDGFSNSSRSKGTRRRENMKERIRERDRLEDLQKKIDTIESLKVRLAAGDEIESDQLEKIANGDITQEDIDHISAEMPKSNSQTSSKGSPWSGSSASSRRHTPRSQSFESP